MKNLKDKLDDGVDLFVAIVIVFLSIVLLNSIYYIVYDSLLDVNFDISAVALISFTSVINMLFINVFVDLAGKAIKKRLDNEKRR